MYTSGINSISYLNGYSLGEAKRSVTGLNFADTLQKAAGTTGRTYTLRGKADASAGEQVVGSFVNVQAGTSSAIYKPADFDEGNPVYHVKTWDMDGNMTERMVDISKINTRNSDEVDMYTYSWHLNNSGQYPQAQLKFAAARAYQQAVLGSSFQSAIPTRTNWASVINSLMQTQYSAGNLQGYLDYQKFLGFMI